VSFAFDCLLSAYLLLASLTIWCAQATTSVLTVTTGPVSAQVSAPGPRFSGTALLRLVEPGLASLPNAMGSLSCLIAAFTLTIGAPFDPRYSAIAVLGVALYLVMVNLSHLIEDWQNGVPVERMACVRSLLPAILATPMMLAGLRLI